MAALLSAEEVAITLGELLLATHRASLSLTPRVICADGLVLSIQASRFHYCSPRNDIGPWSAVEVGYPTKRVEALLPFAEEAEKPTNTVYGYVPIGIVAQVIAEHCGFAKAEGR